MLCIVLLDITQVDDTVANLVVVAVLSGAVIAITHTIAAIQITDICLALGRMHSPPVGFRVGAVSILRVVFLHNRLKVVLTCTGGNHRGPEGE